jgi:hypothetical protein
MAAAAAVEIPDPFPIKLLWSGFQGLFLCGREQDVVEDQPIAG